MLTLTTDQMTVLTEAQQEVFLERIRAHLERRAEHLPPAQRPDYAEPAQRERLRELLRRVVAAGCTRERDAATAIEYFELFGIDADGPQADEVLANTSLSTYEKLDALWRLRTPESTK